MCLVSCVNLILSEQSLKNIFFSEHEHWTFISPTQQTFQQWKFLGENINHPSWLMSSGPGGNWYKQSFSFSNFCNNFIDIITRFFVDYYSTMFSYIFYFNCVNDVEDLPWEKVGSKSVKWNISISGGGNVGNLTNFLWKSLHFWKKIQLQKTFL